MNDRENRRHLRSRSFLGALIVYNSGHSVLNCIIKDLSESGARVKVENAISVPAAFELRLADGRSFDCVVQWRQINSLGISFT